MKVSNYKAEKQFEKVSGGKNMVLNIERDGFRGDNTEGYTPI